MRELPAGTVTFLFTDIEGSTRLLHEPERNVAAGKLTMESASFEEHWHNGARMELREAMEVALSAVD